MTAAEPTGDAAFAPPHDLAAEQATLGAILLSPDAARQLLPLLREEMFYRPAHGELFGVMRDLHAAGHPVDPITVHAELRRRGRLGFGERNSAVVVHDLLAATPTVANGRYYAAIVAETAARRRAVEAGVRLTQLATRGDLDDLMTAARQELACVRAAVDRHHALTGTTRADTALAVPGRPLRAVNEPDTSR